MEIIVEGHKIDTKDIWAINSLNDGRTAGFEICLTDKEPIKITRHIAYENTPREIGNIQEPYRKLQKLVEEKWNADKTDIPVFKI